MNRTVIFGIAIFFAVVGIALMGGEKKAVAGHGCHGCQGCVGAGVCDGVHACAGACHGRACHGCFGRKCKGGLFGGRRCHNACHHVCAGACHHACVGAHHHCNGVITDPDYDMDVPPDAPPEPPPAEARQDREPMKFHHVSFRR